MRYSCRFAVLGHNVCWASLYSIFRRRYVMLVSSRECLDILYVIHCIVLGNSLFPQSDVKPSVNLSWVSVRDITCYTHTQVCDKMNEILFSNTLLRTELKQWYHLNWSYHSFYSPVGICLISVKDTISVVFEKVNHTLFVLRFKFNLYSLK